MTILVYKDGRWLIDNEQPLEGVSLDNLAAFLSNPKDGDVVKYDEESGMWIAGEAGGGSSGGGVLVVHATGEFGARTLDKTWEQIHDALLSGGAVLVGSGQSVAIISSVEYSEYDELYYVGLPGNSFSFHAADADGYPIEDEPK